LKASKETDHDLDAAEGRDEKRWMMKEVERKCKKLKQDEVKRVATLVERAASMDPRLMRHKNEVAAAKEKAANDKEQKERAEREEKENSAASAAKEAEDAEEERKVASANNKAAKDKEKKLIRKNKNAFRKVCMQAFEEKGANADVWADLTVLNDEVEFLCENLDAVDSLPSLTSALGGDTADIVIKFSELSLVRKVYEETKSGTQSEYIKVEAEKAKARRDAVETERLAKAARAPKPWSKAELSALGKAVKKFIAGGNRWELIANSINSLLCSPEPRGKDECIAKWTELAEEVKKVRSNSINDDGKAAVTAQSVEEAPVIIAKQAPGDWSEKQDAQLTQALVDYPSSLEKNERWAKVGKAVDGKTMKDCVTRFKVKKDALKKK
jgi:DnaJ family protein C protein 2